MKKIILLIILVFLLVIMANFANSIYHLWRKKDLLQHVQKQLDREEAENKRLKAELSESNSPQFIEKEARNKLFLVKSGETTILIPQDLQKENQTPKSKGVQPNWVRWKTLF